MIASFFHDLSDHGVEALLISGQAAVLYGAATFSEDIDLWINPTSDNCARFLSALRGCHARYYKLTPPFAVDHLLRGLGGLPLGGREPLHPGGPAAPVRGTSCRCFRPARGCPGRAQGIRPTGPGRARTVGTDRDRSDRLDAGTHAASPESRPWLLARGHRGTAPTSRDRAIDPRRYRGVTRIRRCLRPGKSRCSATKSPCHTG
jgi:hypothetical protein